MVSMVTAVTMAATGVAAAHPAGVAAAHTPKPSPSPTPTPTPTSTAAYTITDLGSLGYGVTRGLAINDNGQVTGYSYTGKTITLKTCCGGCYPGGPHTPCVEHLYHAFVWSNGTMTDLGTLGGNFSQGDSINLSGEVVGSADATTGGSSFLWDGTKMTALSGIGAAGINDSGQIAGGCGTGSGNHACLHSNGKVTQLPNPSTFTPYNCGASEINNNGQILGGCDDTSSYEHAVVWQNGTPTDLGTFGGPQAEAAGINDLGQVVGFAQTSTDADHGFLWSNGTMTDLGLNFFPSAINDNGVIVGGDQIYRGGTLQNLNDLIPAGSGFTIDNATAINDKGQIVAEAGGHTLLLTPN
jgi:probable HAF family extracellular repeat protein